MLLPTATATKSSAVDMTYLSKGVARDRAISHMLNSDIHSKKIHHSHTLATEEYSDMILDLQQQNPKLWTKGCVWLKNKTQYWQHR
jgi:hypothetical protein